MSLTGTNLLDTSQNRDGTGALGIYWDRDGTGALGTYWITWYNIIHSILGVHIPGTRWRHTIIKF
jgi:hypothetical protein